jgi:hypothetical protein
MMGVIIEDKHSDLVKKMVNQVGMKSAIKLFGGWNELKSILKHDETGFINTSKEGKIEIIKDMLGDDGMIYGEDGWEWEPEGDILFEDDKIRKVIFGYYDYGVFIETYRKKKDGSIKDQIFNPNNPDDTYNYEDLPDDVFEQVFQNVMTFAPIRLTEKEN